MSNEDHMVKAPAVHLWTVWELCGGTGTPAILLAYPTKVVERETDGRRVLRRVWAASPEAAIQMVKGGEQ